MGYFKELSARIDEAKHHATEALRMECLKPKRMEIVGSAYITDSNSSDIDVLVEVEFGEFCPGVEGLAFNGWAYGGSVGEGNDSNWGSWKKTFPGVGDVNLLVTGSKEYFNAWLTAAEVCRFLALRGIVVPRAERVGIHNIIMDDSDASSELDSLKTKDVTDLLS